MRLSNIKIPNCITNKKSVFIKTGIFSAILACWVVILVGTFITLKKKLSFFLDGCFFTDRSSICKSN